jgi:alpha-tubulin suppressor-like RCC1 family protein
VIRVLPLLALTGCTLELWRADCAEETGLPTAPTETGAVDTVDTAETDTQETDTQETDTQETDTQETGETGDTVPLPTPYIDVVDVAVGAAHACLLRSTGEAVCWGTDLLGETVLPGSWLQLDGGAAITLGVQAKTGGPGGAGDNTFKLLDFPYPGPFESVAVGGNFACALQADAKILCWGDDAFGQASPGVNVDFTQISAGRTHACGGSAGKWVCWGDGSNEKTVAQSGAAWEVVVAGDEHSCGIATGGDVKCAGDNTFGQSSPPARAFTELAAGRDFTCGLTTKGGIACWGDDALGQSTPPAGTYLHVETSAAARFACAIEDLGAGTQGQVVCWGDDSAGQLTVPLEEPK